MRIKDHMKVFLFVMTFCIPALSFAEPIEVEGTIQGLMSFCENKMCTPGEEMIIAAMEETYVLATAGGDYYLLPNIKKTQLARHLGKTVRVQGEPKLSGKAIMVQKAEVQDNGEWRAFFGRDIVEKRRMLEEFYMLMTP